MSRLGGAGFSLLSSLTPSAVAGIGSAIDSYLRNQQSMLAQQHDSIERQKDRDAQIKAAKEQKKAQKKAQSKQLGMTLGIAGGAALTGGLAAAALAPEVAAGSVAATAPAVESAAGSGIIGAGAPTASTIADAALAAPSLAGSQGIINAGGYTLSGVGGGGAAAAGGGFSGGGALLGGGVGAGAGYSGMQAPPNYSQTLQAGGYQGNRGQIFAGNFAGNFLNALAPGSGNAILGMPSINPQSAFQLGNQLTNTGLQYAQMGQTANYQNRSLGMREREMDATAKYRADSLGQADRHFNMSDSRMRDSESNRAAEYFQTHQNDAESMDLRRQEVGLKQEAAARAAQSAFYNDSNTQARTELVYSELEKNRMTPIAGVRSGVDERMMGLAGYTPEQTRSMADALLNAKAFGKPMDPGQAAGRILGASRNPMIDVPQADTDAALGVLRGGMNRSQPPMSLGATSQPLSRVEQDLSSLPADQAERIRRRLLATSQPSGI